MKKSANRSKISNKQAGFLVVLSAPSGCGKTTLLTRLLKRHPEWKRSVSVTTRPPRLGERSGLDYEFVSLKEFQALRKKKALLEWAQIFDHYYGSPKTKIEQEVKGGKIVLLAVDVQGARSLRKKLANRVRVLSLFILPPSISVLRERLEGRQTDSPAEIEKRIERAQDEIKAAREYDHTIINHDLDQTIHEVESLISEFTKNA